MCNWRGRTTHHNPDCLAMKLAKPFLIAVAVLAVAGALAYALMVRVMARFGIAV